LGDGKELEEVKATFKDQASGTGFKTDKKVIIAREWAKILRTEGVIRINKCFDRFTNIISTITAISNTIIFLIESKQAKDLFDAVVKDSDEARRDILAGKVNARLLMGMELQRKSRTDFFINLSQKSDEEKTNPLLNVLYQLLGPKGKLRELYEILVTKEGKLYEMAAMITELGSDRQSIHADMPFHSEPPLYSIFAALQDITFDMGPTVFLPGTISTKDQQEWSSLNGRDDFLKKRTPYFALLSAGDLIVYDPRVLHCGAANQSSSKRAMFNLGFRNPKFKNDMSYEGSLRPLYADRITFGEFTKVLDAFDKYSNINPFSCYGDGINSNTISKV